jgi:hypothetical protein
MGFLVHSFNDELTLTSLEKKPIKGETQLFWGKFLIERDLTKRVMDRTVLPAIRVRVSTNSRRGRSEMGISSAVFPLATLREREGGRR